MDNLQKEIQLRLTVDGKQMTATLSAGDAQFQEIISKAETLKRTFTENVRAPMLQEFQRDLIGIGEASEDAISGVSEFIQGQNLTEREIMQVIQSLEQEKQSLATGSTAWKNHAMAISNLQNAYSNVTRAQMSMNRHSNQMTMTLGQLGYAIGDADMFFINFRMGMMSVANNIPMVAMGFLNASNAAKIAGTSIKTELISSLMGPGGLLLAINGLMFLLNVVPRLFDNATKEIKKQKDEVKKLRDEYAKLTEEQIKNRLQQIELEMQKLEAKHPAQRSQEIRSQYYSGSAGGLTTPVSGSERFGDDYKRTQELEKQSKALKDTLQDLGIIENIQNRINYNQNALNKLNENEASPFYWKNVVKTAGSYKEAVDIVNKWIKADQKLVDNAKSKSSDSKSYANTLTQNYETQKKINELQDKGNLNNIRDTQALVSEALKRNNSKQELLALLQLQKQLEEDLNQNEIDFFKESGDLEQEKVDTAREIDKQIADIHYLTQAEIDKINAQGVENYFDQQRMMADADLQAQEEKYQNYANYAEIREALEMKHSQTISRINEMQLRSNLQTTSEVLGNIAGLFAKHTVAYKTFAIANTIMDTYQAAVAAYKSAAEVPLIGFILAPAAAAAAIAYGEQQVESIMGVNNSLPGYKKGGVIVGENGMEVIEPAQEYAEGQAKLILMTMMTLKEELRSGNSAGVAQTSQDNINPEVHSVLKDIRDLIKDPPAPILTKSAINEMYRLGVFNNRRSKT